MNQQLQHDDSNDSGLAKALETGDIAVLGKVLQRYGAQTARKIKHRFGDLLNDADIDDVIAISLVKLWRERRRFDARVGKLETWFYILARNAAIDLLRARLREREMFRAQMDEAPQHTQSAAGDELPERMPTEKLSVLKAKIQQLSDRDQAILNSFLSAKPGVDWATEMADELDMTENAVRVRLSRLLKKLRMEVAQYPHIIDES
jgi:RNA polymerase sigma factor (sigma-70 family)